MKHRLTRLTLTTLIIGTIAATAMAGDGDGFSKAIVGSWTEEPQAMGEMSIQRVTSFSGDGTYAEDIALKKGNAVKKHSVTGKWSISGSKLRLVVTTSTAPFMEKPGDVTVMVISSITAEKLTIVYDDSEKEVLTRVKTKAQAEGKR